MSDYQTKFSTRELPGDTFTRTPERTQAVISLRPPLAQVGPKFGSLVLGKNAEGITLEHMVTTDKATLFLAEIGSYRDTTESRQEKVRLMADRVVKAAEVTSASPILAISMMEQSPFAQPEQPLRIGTRPEEI